MSSEPPPPVPSAPPATPAGRETPRPLTGVRLAVATGVGVIMAFVGYVGIVFGAFATYPACKSTPPPGPPSFLVTAAILTLVCGGVPALIVGVRRRRAALIAFALGGLVPFVLGCYVASRTGEGFCI